MSAFYVYTLTDPRNGRVFYVGKGKGDRIEAHEKEARAGRLSRKCDAIRDIWAAGHDVERAVVSRFADEAEAYRSEAALIAEIGLANLANIAPGGMGGRHKRPHSRWTPAMLKQIAPSLRRALNEMRRGDGRLYACGNDITQAVVDLLSILKCDLGDAAVASHLK